jgi:hypothetical protein
MEPLHWTCPFCDRDTTIKEDNCKSDSFSFTVNNVNGYRYFTTSLIVCPNPKCRQFTLSLRMAEYNFSEGQWRLGKTLQTWDLIPPSSAKAFPDYVPKAIRDDYLEACLIRDLSPKASATLSRRCLQGMIRDFGGIRKARLVDEIEAVKDKTDNLTWAAIDSVRKIGNIGAHMEKDINLIVDVDPNEAQMLIGLIELLIKDWYMTRREREDRLKSIVQIGEAKAAIKSGNGDRSEPATKSS